MCDANFPKVPARRSMLAGKVSNLSLHTYAERDYDIQFDPSEQARMRGESCTKLGQLLLHSHAICSCRFRRASVSSRGKKAR